MTPKQEMFCNEYLVDLNATQAAIRAGYSAKTAMEQGYQLRQKPSVHQRIEELKKERQNLNEGIFVGDYMITKYRQNAFLSHVGGEGMELTEATLAQIFKEFM